MSAAGESPKTPDTATGVSLRLPIPPSPNAWPSHPFALGSAKNQYRKKAWAAAVVQMIPFADPPSHVTVEAVFHFCRQPRDEDNLQAGLKWTLDALRQRQRGNLKWRHGLWLNRGYFVDDDPQHLTLSTKQARVGSRKEEHLELVIRW